MKPDQARLRALLHYEPATGVFTRLVPRGRSPKGAVCGSTRPDGYLQIGIDGVCYLSHRLAWLYMTGDWPVEEIDHVNLDRADNRWINLRAASRAENAANKTTYNEIGLKGVYRVPGTNRYEAQITIDRRRHYLGSFETAAKVHRAYRDAADRAFGKFSRS